MTNGGFMTLGGDGDDCKLGGMFGGAMVGKWTIAAILVVIAALAVLAYTIYLNYKVVYDMIDETKRPKYEMKFWKAKTSSDPSS